MQVADHVHSSHRCVRLSPNRGYNFPLDTLVSQSLDIQVRNLGPVLAIQLGRLVSLGHGVLRSRPTITAGSLSSAKAK